jgi:hypothetical protein
MTPQEELEHWQRIAGQGVQTEHALRVEIERLRELFRKDGEQHAEHICGLNERHETRLNAYAAEIERLQAWSEKLANERLQDGADIERLRAQNTEAAAFLDALAERLEKFDRSRGYGGSMLVVAAECRAMAAKLRGET